LSIIANRPELSVSVVSSRDYLLKLAKIDTQASSRQT
jgi:hypothetical protein